MTSSLNVCWIILLHKDKCSLYTSSKKLLFARVTDNTENHNWSKFTEQLTLVCPGSVHISTLQLKHLKIENHLGKGDRKIVKDREVSHMIP